MNINIIYTIGHSNRSIKDFIDILINYKITMVIDVRKLPGSNKNPQYNQNVLIEELTKNGVGYKHFVKLGGLRKSITISASLNSYWQNKSFKNYANFAMTNEFQEGLYELISLANNYRCVIMCAEILWWKCHRRIITDYLIINNKEVIHIFNINNIKKATLTNSAHINKEKIINYINL